jgi:hypothetical protein
VRPYAGLELLAALGFATCLIVGSRRLSPSARSCSRRAVLWVVGLAISRADVELMRSSTSVRPACSSSRSRVIIAVLMFNFALRESAAGRCALWVLGDRAAPLPPIPIVHSAASGWRSPISIPFSVVLYGGRGAGAGSAVGPVGVRLA